MTPKTPLLVTIIILCLISFEKTNYAQEITPRPLSRRLQAEKDNLNAPKHPVITRLPITVTMSGYVSNNIFWNTYQIFGFQELDALASPKPKLIDPCGADIHAHGSINILPIESNIRFDFIGPDVGSAAATAAIETNFFGQEVISINQLTMLQAYIALDWANVSLLAGQSYHPIMFPALFPDPISYNKGMPIVPYAFAPQFRVTYHSSWGDIIFAALSEVNTPLIGLKGFDGPSGPSTMYFRNGIMPKLHLQWRAPLGNHFIGIGADIKRLVPRLVTNTGFKAEESLVSGAAITYFEFYGDRIKGAAKATLAQNGIDYSLTGGYAVSTINPDTDQRTYANLTIGSLCFDIERSGILEPGIFVGVLKNLGASKNIIQSIDTPGRPVETTIYGFNTDMDTLFRCAPRLRYYYEPLVVGTEIEITRAAFGTIDNQGEVINTKPTTNARFLLAVYYFF